MRMLIAAIGLLATTGVADAQALAGRGMSPVMQHHPMGQRWSGQHWGSRIQGRWWGGWRAPGGWGAYRAPVRGWVLPRYWIAPQFYVVDWRGYGLPQPPAGYRWSRYYDDAVLSDDRGSVYDSIGGVAWDRYDAPGADRAYDEPGYDAPMPPPPPPPPPSPAGAGYDQPPLLDGHRRGPPPPMLPPPPLGHDGVAPGPIVTSTGSGRVHSETHVTGGGYFDGGYYYPPATVTTITIDNPDCGETTHTDYVTERVVRRPAPRRAPPSKLLRRTPTKALRR